MRALFNFFGLTQKPEPEEMPGEILPEISVDDNAEAERLPPDDATRPSYRVGGDRTKAFHRVIDMSG